MHRLRKQAVPDLFRERSYWLAVLPTMQLPGERFGPEPRLRCVQKAAYYFVFRSIEELTRKFRG